MRILHVTDNYTPHGGVEQYLLSVTGLLARHGHDNIILYLHERSEILADGPWPSYQLPPEYHPEAVASYLRSILDSEQLDVAYVHQVTSPEVIAAVTHVLPSIAYMHNVSAICPGLAKYYRRGDRTCTRPYGWGCVPMHYLRRCSAARHPRTLAQLMRKTARLKYAYQQMPRVLVASEYMQSLLIQNGFTADRISLLAPHFLTSEQIPTYRTPEFPYTILYAGRLEIEKGVPYLLRALRLLPEGVRLMIAGDGTLRAEYERMCESLGLTSRVQFLGWIESNRLSGCYQQSALTVIPSICPEPFGKTGIEALTQGRPVVAFAVGGIPEWLDDGVTGLLAHPTDSADLACKIQALLEDRQRQEAMGRHGQRIVAERYASDQHLVTLEAALYDVCDA